MKGIIEMNKGSKITENMEHKYESNIKCPYCDWEDKDSWEFGQDNGIQTCGRCEEEFNVERQIEVTYTTSRIDCEEKQKEHDYQFESKFRKVEIYKNGIWVDLPEDQCQYTKIMICSSCGCKKFVQVSKEEYFNLPVY